ncbi:MAG: histidine--tRNA ligase [Flavobacteriaceae bacterium]|jgi:histidyl-tRNA synthetase
MAQKPSTPKGMRDFLPHEVAKRTYLIQTIRNQFEKFGFLPIETPAMERREVLLGKYGDEGDRLVFKVLNSGEKVKKADLNALSEGQLALFSNSLSEKALRYDLTVPLARFVAQHQNDIQFPFKRYQIQSVWRADRPQHGRFQEFTQCDADVIGSDSRLVELEFVQLFDAVFTDLGLKDCTLRINHREILSLLAQQSGAEDRVASFLIILDKLDKIGWDGVIKSLKEEGFTTAVVEKLRASESASMTPSQKIDMLAELIDPDGTSSAAFDEMRFLFSTASLNSLKVDFDWTLARGLDYYTGAIFELAPPKQVKVGTIAAGGRYDDLTSTFGLSDMSGIGVSFGLDRLYLVLEELRLFPSHLASPIHLMVVQFDQEMITQLMPFLNRLRSSGVNITVYPNSARLKKQFHYADKLGIPYVLTVGSEEFEKGQGVLKNMLTGTQKTISLEALDVSFFE